MRLLWTNLAIDGAKAEAARGLSTRRDESQAAIGGGISAVPRIRGGLLLAVNVSTLIPLRSAGI